MPCDASGSASTTQGNAESSSSTLAPSPTSRETSSAWLSCTGAMSRCSRFFTALSSCTGWKSSTAPSLSPVST